MAHTPGQYLQGGCKHRLVLGGLLVDGSGSLENI